MLGIDTLNKPELVEFNGISYRLMGAKRYYLSQYKSYKDRAKAKGLHVDIYEFYSEKKVRKGNHVHHKDGNPFNNYFENLEAVSVKEHRKLTNHKTEKLLNHLDRIRPLAVAWHKSNEGRLWHKHNSLNRIVKNKRLKCVVCEKSFWSKFSDAQYCSARCFEDKYKYHIKWTIHKNCEWCKKEFITKTRTTSKTKTCSVSCKTRLTWFKRRS